MADTDPTARWAYTCTSLCSASVREAAWSTRAFSHSVAGLQSSGARLAEDERNVLTSWAALVFLTAEEVGCPAGDRRGKPSERADAGGGGRGGDRGGSAADTGSSGSGRSANVRNSASTSGTGSGAGAEAVGADDGGSSAMSLGMRRFVKQAVAQFAGGTRLTDLIELQVKT